MAKNRLEAAFRSAPDPSSKSEGGKGEPPEPSSDDLTMMLAALPGNYFNLAMEEARWKLIRKLEQEGRLEEFWDDPFIQASDYMNMVRFFPIIRPPEHADNLTARMLTHHYREIVRRFSEQPENLTSFFPACTIPEVFAFTVQALADESFHKSTENIGSAELFAMTVYRCIERVYGQDDAKLFLKFQLKAYHREREAVAKSENMDGQGYKLTNEIVPLRLVLKFVVDNFDIDTFTQEKRKAIDNLLAEYCTKLPSIRRKFALAEQSKSGVSVEKIIKKETHDAADCFITRTKWQDWTAKPTGG